MFEKTPLQQCVQSIITTALAGAALWVTLLIQASFTVRDTLTDSLLVHIGPFDLTSIERFHTNGHESIRMRLEPGLLYYFVACTALGIVYYYMLRTLHKYLLKK